MNRRKYLNPRPHITAPLEREIKIEARFACIVCRERVSLNKHHIDGNRENNVLENIALLCANCHGLVHDSKITTQDLRQCKVKVSEENNILSRLAKEIEYFQKSPKVIASEDYIELKLKYQSVLSDYGDKLIFYQCLVYLIPEFYIDERGQKTREVVRSFINIDEEEETRIIAHLQKIGAVNIVGGLLTLNNNNDAKIALNELITKGRFDVSQLLEVFSDQ